MPRYGHVGKKLKLHDARTNTTFRKVHVVCIMQRNGAADFGYRWPGGCHVYPFRDWDRLVEEED